MPLFFKGEGGGSIRKRYAKLRKKMYAAKSNKKTNGLPIALQHNQAGAAVAWP